MSTIDQMLDRLFQQRVSRMQAKTQRQRDALRRLQDKRGVKIVDDERIIFEDQEWMPTERFHALREKYEKQMEVWRIYDADDVIQRRIHRAFYESAERQLASFPSLDYGSPHSLQYAFSVMVEEYRGMLAMGLREKLEKVSGTE